jgi:hypothetical protein
VTSFAERLVFCFLDEEMRLAGHILLWRLADRLAACLDTEDRERLVADAIALGADADGSFLDMVLYLLPVDRLIVADPRGIRMEPAEEWQH